MANTWQNNEYKLIRFAKTSAGTDISDASLSAWLEANAEQFLQAEYDLNNIVMSGSHTITCKGRATGYQDSEASNSVTITVYAIQITATGCTYVGLPYIVQNGSPRTIVFTAASGYSLPSSVTVTGCDHTWDQATGTLVLSNPTASPSVTVTATQITYSITTNVTNGTSSGSSTIAYGGTASVTITPTTGYELPSSVTVVNATSSYNDTTGVISLSAPTGNVTITAVCQLPQLDAPTNVSVSGTTATFDEVENAESYEFFVDGTSIGEYSVQSGYTVVLTNSDGTCPNLSLLNDAGVQYSTDGGTTWTSLGDGADDTSTTITLTNISSLLLYPILGADTGVLYGWDGSSWVYIYTADYFSLDEYLGTYSKFGVQFDL